MAMYNPGFGNNNCKIIYCILPTPPSLHDSSTRSYSRTVSQIRYSLPSKSLGVKSLFATMTNVKCSVTPGQAAARFSLQTGWHSYASLVQHAIRKLLGVKQVRAGSLSHCHGIRPRPWQSLLLWNHVRLTASSGQHAGRYRTLKATCQLVKVWKY